MSKQTAVEFIEQQLKKYNVHIFSELNDCLKQAKAMEREQIMEAYGVGHNDGCSYMTDGKTEFKNAEQYYEQIYGKEASHEG